MTREGALGSDDGQWLWPGGHRYLGRPAPERGRIRDSGHVDRKHAPFVGDVAGINPAMVGLDSPSAESETQAQPGAIRAPLFAGTEQAVVVSSGQAAAFIMNFDQNALRTGVHL